MSVKFSIRIRYNLDSKPDTVLYDFLGTVKAAPDECADANQTAPTLFVYEASNILADDKKHTFCDYAL